MNAQSFYCYLADELYRLADEWILSKNYQLLYDRLSKIETERCPVSLTNALVFEGERCSGKDTIIDRISQVNASCIPMPRLSDNAAWQRLCSMKKNCYFAVDDYIVGNLLWFSDLSHRLSQWLKVNSTQTILINRYIDSLVIIQNSLLRYEQKAITSKAHILAMLAKMFPRPPLTFVLNIDLSTLLSRMNNSRNRTLSECEIAIAHDNILAFRNLSTKGHIHIDACMPIDIVANTVLEYICANERRVSN